MKTFTVITLHIRAKIITQQSFASALQSCSENLAFSDDFVVHISHFIKAHSLIDSTFGLISLNTTYFVVELNFKLSLKWCQNVLDILNLFLPFRILIVLVVSITLYKRLVYMEHAKLQNVVPIPANLRGIFWFALTMILLNNLHTMNILIFVVPIALFGKRISHALIHLEPLF